MPLVSSFAVTDLNALSEFSSTSSTQRGFRLKWQFRHSIYKATNMFKAKNAKAKNPQIPLPALLLGLAGLIPFVASAIASVVLEAPFRDRASFSLGAYGAVILSFLGGVKWGAALHDPKALKQWAPLVLSVLPSIIAWFALLLPSMYSLSLLAVALVGQYYLDRQSVEQGVVPDWYGRLRMILTTGAVLSVLLGFVASFL